VSNTLFIASEALSYLVLRFAARYLAGDEDVKRSVVQFAGEKLLCKSFSTTDESVRKLTDVQKMACMCTRLPLEFGARTTRSQDMEETLVERHMRICRSVDPGFEMAMTTASSESLLAEASYLLMRSEEFDLPRSSLAELEPLGLNKGDRGELVGMTLCLQARDAAATKAQSRIVSVVDFVSELLAQDSHKAVFSSKPTRARTLEEGEKSFRETFKNSKMYFNHFIKLRDRGTISREFLWRLSARGTAACCADYQFGVDIVIPFTYWDTRLCRENITAIMTQVKNDASYQVKVDRVIV
jgi:hypothetical protein